MTRSSDKKLWLRIIQVNDVYELRNLPHLKTLIDAKGSNEDEGPDKILVLMAGDFLAPSLLSSLDKGRGMIDTMNACGVTHVCIGNHECDVGDEPLAQRIRESQFIWINTNMRELDERLDVHTVPHDVIEITSSFDGKQYTKQVALIGLLTEDPSIYRPGSFGNAKIEPVIQCTHNYMKLLEKEQPSLDLVIPVTHQRMNFDRIFCEEFGGDRFPVVLGGHDHEMYDQVVNGSRILKTGMDADLTAIVDIRWSMDDDEQEPSKPEITVEMIPTRSYGADSKIQEIVDSHEKIVSELKSAKLFRFSCWLSDGEGFSTHNNRLEPTNGSRVLCTILRMGMRCHCCILNAGNIRAGKVYPPDQEWFTWSDLKGEIVFPTHLHVMAIPGQVVQDCIAHSRNNAKMNPPIAFGGYLHHCDAIEYDDEQQKILRIQGEPFEPDREYLTALPGKFFEGIDNHAPLLAWAEANNISVDDDCGKPAKLVVVETFAALLWLKLGSFDSIDQDGDGILTRQEVRAKAQSIFGENVADMVVDSIFSVADLNHNGMITPVEMMVVQFVASDMLNHIASNEELAVMQHIASTVLGNQATHDEVKQVVKALMESLDMDHSGRITREEAMKALGEVRRRSLLI